ncbi:MAG: Long-chain-fatty-acid--CoA ligase FadD15 [Deltaproteobacteria bacterium ADurb.BinA179]|jgi:long-chain acyl-CoA synthetase|nr:MAG: Long-chain-fatty-acid--CoA ligase FadD15 [Deltaproteobacteria bacterium ADurb.BinA179]HOE73068.1 long-chain fatty acid--CoA ligase [Deltaproteobacteria bacterium]HRR21499.1 long-chain fatty acid--CoA ligase [Desulfomonilia bacterium]HOS26926.1 long-chain fatty acid--CoA ligase [Deltaproteobacteria bacterium]HQM20850.1 long-chain fatty acid--CoA ligase [Deltaproteobacteria bacterium]
MGNYRETSMGAIFQNRVQELGEKACVAYKNAQGVYTDISWRQMDEMVRKVGYFLLSRGIKPGDKIALFSPNRYEWWVTDLAILSIGAVNVPIYATNSAVEAKYIIENSDSVICFTGEKEHLDKVMEVRDKLPGLREIIVFDDLKSSVEGVIDLKEAMKQGSAFDGKAGFEERLKGINPDDMATIIYTSGTTGDPKGVMLSHNNFISNVNQLYSVDPELFKEEHTLLSFLPLSHSFERTVGYYSALNAGKKVCFAEDFSKILQNLQEVRPTLIVSVPRLYEKIHAGILAKVSEAPPVKKALFNWAMSLAKKNLPYICRDKPRKGLFALQYALADKIIFSKLKAALGMDRLRFALSGGGPLSVSDAEFFLGMGIKVCEGFGLTETSPVTHGNRPDFIKPGTVGPALKDTLVKIGEGGEVLIKGPQVMMGYYKNEAATKEVMTEDGFFRTGDIGEIDSDGYLKITGRIKDLIVTSGGKNISPQNIENSLKTSIYIEQVAVIGDNRKYLSALIVPAFAELENWAKNNGISFASRRELLEHPEVQKLFAGEIQENTKHYARVEQIRKFKLLDAEWSQQTDELTPTLKVKRRVIDKKYAREIESMYAEDRG